MKINVKIITSLLLLSFIGCKKFKPEPIEDDLQYVVGKWNWDSTYHKYNWCTGGATLEETIYAESHDNSFSVAFSAEGYLCLYADDSLLSSQGLTIDVAGQNPEGEQRIIFNKENGGKIAIIGDTNRSRITAFPYTTDDGGCEQYTNYFSKE